MHYLLHSITWNYDVCENFFNNELDKKIKMQRKEYQLFKAIKLNLML